MTGRRSQRESGMPVRAQSIAPSAAPELVIMRVFDAPRHLVFEAWTQPEQLAAWWGPQGFTTVDYAMDVRPGGAWFRRMRSPEGELFVKRGVYREVVAPERLVFTYVNEAADGTLDQETLVTVTFAEEGARTRLTLAPHRLRDGRLARRPRGRLEQLHGALRRLPGGALKGSEEMAATGDAAARSAAWELAISRSFDAPRGEVFQAWTDPARIVRWWGPRGFRIPSCRMDVREGGAWRVCMRSPEGTDHWVQGVFREVAEPDRLAFTWAWEDEDGKPGHETVVKVDFTEQGGRTQAPRAAGHLRVAERPRAARGRLEQLPRPPRGASARHGRRRPGLSASEERRACNRTRSCRRRNGWWRARRILAKEKELTRLRDQLAAERRELPWVRVEKAYVFDGPDGKETLAELFAGRSQLIVYHFMFGPDWEEGCKSCSFVADHFDGAIPHLNARDVAMVAVSRAPLARIEAFQRRMGWRFRWVSSYGSDFNYDFHVSFTPEEMAGGEVYYNYRTGEFPSEEAPGVSAFYKDADGSVFHTYSTYARGLDILIGAYNLLDLAPKGRDEAALPWTMAWVRHHDRYQDEEPAQPSAA